jgi:hypothetical protein
MLQTYPCALQWSSKYYCMVVADYSVGTKEKVSLLDYLILTENYHWLKATIKL